MKSKSHFKKKEILLITRSELKKYKIYTATVGLRHEECDASDLEAPGIGQDNKKMSS